MTTATTKPVSETLFANVLSALGYHWMRVKLMENGLQLMLILNALPWPATNVVRVRVM